MALALNRTFFIPFRSSSAADMENRMANMAQLNSVDPDFPAAMKVVSRRIYKRVNIQSNDS
jgi:hypothetical protein